MQGTHKTKAARRSMIRRQMSTCTPPDPEHMIQTQWFEFTDGEVLDLDKVVEGIVERVSRADLREVGYISDTPASKPTMLYVMTRKMWIPILEESFPIKHVVTNKVKADIVKEGRCIHVGWNRLADSVNLQRRLVE